MARRATLFPVQGTNTKAEWAAAVLVHGVSWKAGRHVCALTPEISVNGVSGSPAGRLYCRMCREHGIDGGEPFGFGACVEAVGGAACASPMLVSNSPVAKALTLLVLLAGQPLGLCRFISSRDGFRTGTVDTLLEFTDPSETFDERARNWPLIDRAFCRALKVSWSTLESRDYRQRISRAFGFFQHAWTATDFEVCCLSLAVVLETLCAPHAQSETTHQIAFNVAHLIGGNSDARRTHYALVRQFYRVRSAIVHGGSAEEKSLREITTKVFTITANVLRRILLSRELADVFDDEQQRQATFMDYLFPL